MIEPPRPSPDGPAGAPPPSQYVQALGLVAAATTFGLLTRPWLSVADQAMINLLAVVVAATRLGKAPSLLAAVASVVAFDFCFVPPFYTFAVDNFRYLLTFGVMLGVGVVVSRLTGRIREQVLEARQRERRTAALYGMSRDFAQAVDPGEIARLAVARVHDLTECDTVLWLRTPGGLAVRASVGDLGDDAREVALARWVADHGRAAGSGTQALPAVETLHLPLVGSRGTIGVLAVAIGRRPTPPTTDQRLLLDTFAAQTGLALERAVLADEAEAARLSVETERLRNELLSAVSHDLRTPLASITGAATALLDEPSTPDEARRELLLTIRDESERLGRLVTDLLDLTRIESGAVRATLEWYPVEEVVAAAATRLEEGLAGRTVHVDVPEEVLQAPMDPILVEQVLVNLFENAAKYSPPGAPIDVVARPEEASVRIEVADRGPGLPPGQEDRLFERFFRAHDGDRAGGTGLGLAICRAIVRAHGGRIEAANREGGGAVFRFFLPLEGSAPEAP